MSSTEMIKMAERGRRIRQEQLREKRRNKSSLDRVDVSGAVKMR